MMKAVSYDGVGEIPRDHKIRESSIVGKIFAVRGGHDWGRSYSVILDLIHVLTAWTSSVSFSSAGSIYLEKPLRTLSPLISTDTPFSRQ